MEKNGETYEEMMERDAKEEKQVRKEIRENFQDWDIPPKETHMGLIAMDIQPTKLQFMRKEGKDYGVMESGIRTKKVNKYALFEEKTESYESTKMSSSSKKPGVMILVEKNGAVYRLTMDDWEQVYKPPGEDKKWDRKALHGTIKTKGVSSYGRRDGRGRTGGTKRYKISREALQRTDNLYVLEYRKSTGGKDTQNRGTESWNNFNIENFYRLVPE